MTRRRHVLVLTLAFAAASAVPAQAGERCVGHSPGCSPTLQGALDAAHAGDTIHIGPGRFAGGATITKSVTLGGAGRHRTRLAGGGPVLTIGEIFDATPPTVGIRDLTITGGRTTSSPQSDAFFGRPGVFALGGGIEIPPGPQLDEPGRFVPGANVTLTRVAVTGNRVFATASLPGGEDCGGTNCEFALAAGGGIENSGNLAIVDSSISGNHVGALSGPGASASDAQGGGVQSSQGTLTIVRSRIDDNDALAGARIGRFADGGGIFSAQSPTFIRDSEVAGNRSQVAAALPAGVEVVALAGGIRLTDQVPTARISHTRITGNATGLTNTIGDVLTFSGGLHVDSGDDFAITDSLIAGNRVRAERLAGTSGYTHADGGGGLLFGRMTRTRVVGNRVSAHSPAGVVEAMAGGTWSLFGDVTESLVAGNRVRAASEHGDAFALGAGLVADHDPSHPDQDGVSLTRSAVSGNVGVADGHTATGRGGGIYDAVFPEGPFGAPVSLTDSAVSHNALLGGTREGGGVYLCGQALSRTRSAIAGNLPDQLFSCPATASRAAEEGERGDSNPRPPGPQPGALPAELRPPRRPARHIVRAFGRCGHAVRAVANRRMR